MTKHRLVDFQISVRSVPELEERRRINRALFAAYEPIRLWLRDRPVKAPFRKILIDLSDDPRERPWHGQATVALGICEAAEVVAPGELGARVEDHRWVFARVLDALEHVREKTGSSYAGLVEHVEHLQAGPPVVMHRLEALSKIDRQTGAQCEVWYRAAVGDCAVLARVTMPNRSPHTTVLASMPGPLYLEDEFPVKKSLVKAGCFVLVGPNKVELARVAVRPEESTALH